MEDKITNSYDFVEIIQANEYWNEYLLDDGNVVRCKVVVSHIRKHKTLTDDEGMPRYFVKSQLIFDVRGKQDTPKKEA